MSGNNDFFLSDLLCLLFALFHDCYFSQNVNPYTTRIQSYMGMLKMIQNTEQNGKQNANEVLGNIPVFNDIFDILISPFVENENGRLWDVSFEDVIAS